MSFTKCIHPQSQRILLFTQNYNRSITHVNELVSELKKDFPHADDKDIEVREFDNSSNNRIMVIVFNNYTDFITPAEYTLAPIDAVRLKL